MVHSRWNDGCDLSHNSWPVVLGEGYSKLGGLMKKRELRNYQIKFDTSSDDRSILIMLRAIGKYLYDNADKLLKSKVKAETWTWKAGKKR